MKTRNMKSSMMFSIYHFLKLKHNFTYLGIPKKKVLVLDFSSILETLGNKSLTQSFNSCKSVDDKMKIAYVYINSLKDCPTKKEAKYKIKQISNNNTAKATGVPKKWVENKINQLEDDEKWRALRFQALGLSDGKCCLCGRSPHNGVILHVDHIKPKSLYPELRFDLNNLQVLCEDCNMGKSNFDDTDFRSPQQKKKIFLIKKGELA